MGGGRQNEHAGKEGIFIHVVNEEIKSFDVREKQEKGVKMEVDSWQIIGH